MFRIRYDTLARFWYDRYVPDLRSTNRYRYAGNVCVSDSDRRDSCRRVFYIQVDSIRRIFQAILFRQSHRRYYVRFDPCGIA